jgi:hypothetical protein
MDEIESMELMLKNMKSTKTNVDFFDLMRRGRPPPPLVPRPLPGFRRHVPATSWPPGRQ